MMKNVRKNAQIGRNLLLPVALASGFVATTTRADDDGKRFYVDPMASYTLKDKYRGTDDGIGAQISVGKRLTKGLDLELIGTYTDYKQKDIPSNAGKSDATLYGAGLGANVYLAPSAESFLKGFYLHLDVLRGQGYHSPGPISDYTTTLFDAGLGYKLKLTNQKFGPFAPGIAIRAEALYRHDAHGRGQLGESTADNQHQYFQEATFNLGLHFPLGGRTEPLPPAPEPEVQVVPVEAPPPPAAPEPPPCQPPAPGQPISLEGCKTGDTIILRGVNFEFDKAKLTVNAKTLLDQVADALQARMDIKVEVDGHTDGKGSGPYNQKLSDRRAESVMQYLIGKGIDAGRMTSKGFGKTMPIAPNDTDEGRELNRRVELKIIGDSTGVSVAPADGSAPPQADASAPSTTPDAGAPSAPSDSAPSAPSDSSAPSAPSDSAPSAPSDSAPSSAPSDSTAPK